MKELIEDVTIWGWLSAALLATAAALFARGLASTVPLALPHGGRRGENRRQAFASPVMAALDPALRLSGATVRNFFRRARTWEPLRILTERLERWQRKQLVWAGEPGGLDRFEMIALCLALGAGGAFSGYLWGQTSGSLTWVLPGAIVGAALPNIRLQSLGTERFAEMGRELPAAIDLIALAMNAGADFPGAIRRVIAGQRGVVSEELGELLRSLDLGITRRGALLALQERVPVREVKDLVRAILLAEQKGASITEALSQQASASRQRRSVRAEEAAARAGVLLLVPLMLLMGCIMILLIGPLMTSGVSL